MEQEKYNVYVIGIDDFKASVQVGTNVEYKQLEQLEKRVMFRLNQANFFIGSYVAGSERDLQLQGDLK